MSGNKQFDLAVLAVSKVLNLKANHNNETRASLNQSAVLAVSKVLNLKANHNSCTRDRS